MNWILILSGCFIVLFVWSFHLAYRHDKLRADRDYEREWAEHYREMATTYRKWAEWLAGELAEAGLHPFGDVAKDKAMLLKAAAEAVEKEDD